MRAVADAPQARPRGQARSPTSARCALAQPSVLRSAPEACRPSPLAGAPGAKRIRKGFRDGCARTHAAPRTRHPQHAAFTAGSAVALWRAGRRLAWTRRCAPDLWRGRLCGCLCSRQRCLRFRTGASAHGPPAQSSVQAKIRPAKKSAWRGTGLIEGRGTENGPFSMVVKRDQPGSPACIDFLSREGPRFTTQKVPF